jgi:hypothetical protein
MGVSNEAKNVIPLKFLRKIKKFFFPLVNSIRGHTVYVSHSLVSPEVYVEDMRQIRNRNGNSLSDQPNIFSFTIFKASCEDSNKKAYTKNALFCPTGFQIPDYKT